MSKRDLRGRVALITGASSGVGWQAAVRLSEAGMRLCVTARRREALERLRTELIGRGSDCLVSPGDVTNPDDVERVVADCIRVHGRIDVLVNDAAVQIYAPFEQYSWEEIERVFQVTCFGYMRYARAVLPHFRRQGWGHIINVASMLSEGAAPLLSAYAAAKHAVLGWAQSLRLELYHTGIDVSNVLVPSVATPMFDHAQMKLGWAPQPIPPTYDPDVAARAVLRCARRPNPKSVPVFLQGRLILWMQGVAPFVGDFLLRRWGTRLQERNRHVDPEKGNLWRPVREGVGPYGSVPPTPRWKLWSAGVGLVAVLGLAGLGARRALRAAL
jgi:short-subunit dehydrogenase